MARRLNINLASDPFRRDRPVLVASTALAALLAWATVSGMSLGPTPAPARNTPAKTPISLPTTTTMVSTTIATHHQLRMKPIAISQTLIELGDMLTQDSHFSFHDVPGLLGVSTGLLSLSEFMRLRCKNRLYFADASAS